jgi:hypothetical protein
MYKICAGIAYGESLEFDIIASEGSPLTPDVIESFRTAVHNTLTNPLYMRPFVEIMASRRDFHISLPSKGGPGKEIATTSIGILNPQFECVVDAIPEFFDLRRVSD